jgi:lipopolysaccharide export system protein LptA
MAWQRHARMGVAAIGIATAAVVYLTLGERRHGAQPLAGSQLPPRVLAKSRDAELEHVKGIAPTYRVRTSLLTTFDDGSTRGENVVIDAPNRDGRHFIVTARQSYAAKGNSDIELTEAIDLREDDGFELKTARATFNQASGVARADGDVTFGKGRMTGSGTGVTYDEHVDVLDIRERARVDMTAQGSAPAITFRGRTARLDRMNHLLTVNGDVHVTHGTQIITTATATAHLSDTDDRVKFVELRDGARVEGGLGNVQSMRAREMDLDYAEDGQTIQHATLRGQGAVSMAAQSGTTGRQLEGEALEIAMRPDQTLDRVNGSGGVAMTIPPADGAPARTVRGGTMVATTAPDGALTSAHFAVNVRFDETTGGESARSATSETLDLAMQDDTIGKALFTGRPTFKDGDLQARARDAEYEPGAGTLRLRGSDERGVPSVSDTKVSIDSESIDIGLEARSISGKGRVKSVLSGRQAGDGKSSADANTHLPSMLQQNEPVLITSDEIAYDGQGGVVSYAGRSRLAQGDTTEIRAQSIVIQQNSGDLVATGAVHSTIKMDNDVSKGDASELRYVDEKRTLTYTSLRANSKDTVPLAHVEGPQGDLRARIVTVFLGQTESRLERLKAEDDVVSKIDARTVRGERLTYEAKDDAYTVKGRPAVMDEVVKDGCREAQGGELTFTRSTDTINVDGLKKTLAQWAKKPSCQ